MNINSIKIDSTNSITDLCLLGKKYPTDKCPYNEDNSLHKHAYTAIYDLLFSHIRYNIIQFGEIGILDNNSMKMWREYFPNANLYGYEWYDDKLDKAKEDKLPYTYYGKIDVTDNKSIEEEFKKLTWKFDILIDDSTHIFDDQITLINTTCKYIDKGGILIIEDIFISEEEDRYKKALNHLSKYFSSATFIYAEHTLKYSPGWNNDKLLVLYRNDVPFKECIKLTIITPCTRKENLFAIEDSMKTIPKENYRWIVVFDMDEVPTDIPKSCEPYAIKDEKSVFGNAQRNYAIDLIKEGWIYFNDDDTTIYPELWENIKDCNEDFISFMQANKDGSIRLQGDVISLNYVDSHNFLVSIKCIKDIRWDIRRYDADGIFAYECYQNAKTKKYIPLILSIHNSLK